MAPLSCPMGNESQPGGNREKSSRKTSTGVQAGAAAPAEALAAPPITSTAIAVRRPIGRISAPPLRLTVREASRGAGPASRQPGRESQAMSPITLDLQTLRTLVTAHDLRG